MKILIALLIAGSLSTSICASTPIQKENVKSGRQITGMTFVINNYKQFKYEWDHTSFDHQPHVQAVDKAKVGDTVHLITLFANCFPDQQNQCNMSFKIRVLRDENVVIDSPNQNFKFAQPQVNSLQLSSMVVGSNFESNEIGKYRYEVTITDNNAHETLNLKTYLTVLDK